MMTAAEAYAVLKDWREGIIALRHSEEDITWREADEKTPDPAAALKAAFREAIGIVQEGWRPEVICEFCFKPGDGNITNSVLDRGWVFVWQSYICPDCQPKIERDGGINVVKGGAYAFTKDPRPFNRIPQ